MPRLQLKLNDEESDIKSSPIKETLSTKPNSKVHKVNNLMLNLEILPKFDFNDEFMEKADDFSPSWRDGCRKINLLK